MKHFSKIIYLGVTSVLCTWAGVTGAVGNIADVTVYDRVENRALPIHYHNGRYYVVGKPGNEYQVRIANRGQGEILSVISVDGVNAVSGETANWNQTGYVLGGYQAFDVRGWRKSMDRIAAFFFTEHQNSYAARTGRPHNVGVIGVAVFRKKYEPPVRMEPPRRPWPRPRNDAPYPYSSERDMSGAADATGTAEAMAKSTTPPPPATAAPAQESDMRAQSRDNISGGGVARAPQRAGPLGTGHGRTEESQVTYTNFVRATSAPSEIITLHYDTYENLLAQGVITQPPVYARPAPSPFPGQFVPDPR